MANETCKNSLPSPSLSDSENATNLLSETRHALSVLSFALAQYRTEGRLPEERLSRSDSLIPGLTKAGLLCDELELRLREGKKEPAQKALRELSIALAELRTTHSGLFSSSHSRKKAIP